MNEIKFTSPLKIGDSTFWLKKPDQLGETIIEVVEEKDSVKALVWDGIQVKIIDGEDPYPLSINDGFTFVNKEDAVNYVRERYRGALFLDKTKGNILVNVAVRIPSQKKIVRKTICPTSSGISQVFGFDDIYIPNLHDVHGRYRDENGFSTIRCDYPNPEVDKIEIVVRLEDGDDGLKYLKSLSEEDYIVLEQEAGIYAEK